MMQLPAGWFLTASRALAVLQICFVVVGVVVAVVGHLLNVYLELGNNNFVT